MNSFATRHFPDKASKFTDIHLYFTLSAILLTQQLYIDPLHKNVIEQCQRQQTGRQERLYLSVLDPRIIQKEIYGQGGIKAPSMSALTKKALNLLCLQYLAYEHQATFNPIIVRFKPLI